MTTVVVALDDFTVTVETEGDSAPIARWLLWSMEKTQAQLRPQMTQALFDLVAYGSATIEVRP